MHVRGNCTMALKDVFRLAVQFCGPRTVLIKDLHNTMNNIMIDTTKGETLPTIITHVHAQETRDKIDDQ